MEMQHPRVKAVIEVRKVKVGEKGIEYELIGEPVEVYEKEEAEITVGEMILAREPRRYAIHQHGNGYIMEVEEEYLDACSLVVAVYKRDGQWVIPQRVVPIGKVYKGMPNEHTYVEPEGGEVKVTHICTPPLPTWIRKSGEKESQAIDLGSRIEEYQVGLKPGEELHITPAYTYEKASKGDKEVIRKAHIIITIRALYALKNELYQP